MRLKTNLDFRGYAASKGVTLGEVAKAMGMNRSDFSVQYMRIEQSQEVKAILMKAVDKAAEASNDFAGIR